MEQSWRVWLSWLQLLAEGSLSYRKDRPPRGPGYRGSGLGTSKGMSIQNDLNGSSISRGYGDGSREMFSLDLLLRAFAQADIGQGNRRLAWVLAFPNGNPAGQVQDDAGILPMRVMTDFSDGQRSRGPTGRGFSLFGQENLRRQRRIGRGRVGG